MIKIIPSEKTFKVGDDQNVFSAFQAILPAGIGNTDRYIQTEMLDEKIPLLLSKLALKKVQSFKFERRQSEKEDIDVYLSSNVHYEHVFLR